MKILPTRVVEEVEQKDESVSSFSNEDASLVSHQSSFVKSCCSLRFFIVISMIILILLCSISVYVSVFVLLNQSVNELTDNVLEIVEEKMSVYISSVLNEMISTGITMADHYNYGVSSGSNTEYFRKYFYTPFKVSGVSAGYAFGNPSERYSFTIIGKQGKQEIVYSYQPPGFIGSIRDTYTLDGTLIKLNETIDFTAYHVAQKDFYYVSLNEADRMGKEGAFSHPYIVTNGTLSISYGAKVYDPQQFSQGIKKLKGIARIVKPLSGISDFLANKVKVFKNGFVIIKEYSNDNVIAGSINCTTFDEKARLSIFDVSDKNAGKLMRKLNSTVGSIVDLPKGISISHEGVDYLIRHVIYEFENIKWSVYIVVVTKDILQSTHISIGVSIGVTVLITIIGVAFSIMLSFIILKPISYLKRQFEFIKVFELEHVRHSTSIFSELNQVYSSLSLTVKWLKEIKAFVPESVFLQLQQQEQEDESIGVKKADKEENSTGIPGSVRSSKYLDKSTELRSNSELHSGGASNHLSDSGPNSKNRGLFKLGLSQKECSVLNVRLNNLLRNHSPHTASTIFPKVLTIIGEASKLFQCDYQVISLEEFQIVVESKKKKSSLTAQELALKIRKGIDKLNQQQVESQLFECAIGISTRCNSHVGNLGTKTSRVYSIISNACKMAQRLSCLASLYRISILVDEQTINAELFVSRPVDRIIPHHSVYSNANNGVKESFTSIASSNCAQHPENNPQTIYEIIKESKVEEGDGKFYINFPTTLTLIETEWMYELENKNQNQKTAQYHFVFDLFNNNNSSNLLAGLKEKKEYLEGYLMENGDDIPSKKLLHLINTIEQQQQQQHDDNNSGNFSTIENMLKGYHTKIREFLVEN